MATPEGKVKAKIKVILDQYRPNMYYHMPVQNGMGSPTLDFVGCYFGRYFAIEAKAPGKNLTPRQELTTQTIRAAGGKVFVISSEIGCTLIESWLKENSA
jgi:hypothetical protein